MRRKLGLVFLPLREGSSSKEVKIWNSEKRTLVWAKIRSLSL